MRWEEGKGTGLGKLDQSIAFRDKWVEVAILGDVLGKSGNNYGSVEGQKKELREVREGWKHLYWLGKREEGFN